MKSTPAMGLATNLLAIGALITLSGCVKDRRQTPEAEAAVPERPVDETPIAAQKSQAGLLEIKVELRSDGLLLHVSGIPAGAKLECDLDSLPLVPCHDGALFARPADGDHRISAVALLGEQIAALGQSEPFTVLPGTGGAVDGDGRIRNPLTLMQADAAFVNGAAIPYSKDFVAKFKLEGKPTCKPQIQCKYDSRTSTFWTDCDAGNESFTIPKDLVAAGLQYFSAQATCGEDVGPILTLFFYGVPDDYRPLMIRNVKDANGLHFVTLVKADDCPESQQSFQCAETATDEFSLCAQQNSINNPATGYRIRLVCDGRTGPELTLVP